MKSFFCFAVVSGALLASASAALVARYEFGANVAADSSGNGRNLTATGTVTYGTVLIGSTTLGTVSIAGNPDNNNAAVNYLSRTTGGLGVTDIQNSTISFWANGATMSTSFNNPLATSTGAANGYQVQTDNGSNANDRIQIYPSTGTSPTGSSVGSEGAWHQYVVSINAGVITFYVDGVATAATGTLTATGAMAQLYLGRGSDYSSPTARGWNGSIADVQVYDSALGGTDVAALFANPGTVVPEPSALMLGGLGMIGLLRRRR